MNTTKIILLNLKQETIKSSLCDYSDVFILATGDITVNEGNDTDVGFKNCAPFSTCKTEINYVFVDEANHIFITMPLYNLIEYSDNCAYTSGSLWQFRINEVPADNANLSVSKSELCKYKAALVGKSADAAGGNSFVKNTRIVVSLKYVGSFWRSSELPLINCKIHLELNWIEVCILSSNGDSEKFKITDAKLHVPIITLSTKDSVNVTKQLSNGFKRSVFWNSYQTIYELTYGANIYELLSASFQGV